MATPKNNNRKITLDDVMFSRYGGKEKLSPDVITTIERNFIKMFPKSYDCPAAFFACILPKRKKSTKTELAQILIAKRLVNNIDQALLVVDEMLIREFGRIFGEYYGFEGFPKGDGTILYRVNLH